MSQIDDDIANDDGLDDDEFVGRLFFLDVMFLAGMAIGAAAMYFIYCGGPEKLQDADPDRYRNYTDQSIGEINNG